MATRLSRATRSDSPRCDRVLAAVAFVALMHFTTPAWADIVDIDGIQTVVSSAA